MNILVIDGQGGRLGRKLLENIRKTCPEAHITAVGTNSIATQNMLGSNCADQLATGENAVIVACRTAQIIVGPLGIATADALMGEISPAGECRGFQPGLAGVDSHESVQHLCGRRRQRLRRHPGGRNGTHPGTGGKGASWISKNRG